MSSALYGGGILRECHYGNMIYFKAKKKKPFKLNVLNRDDTQLPTERTHTHTHLQCVINLVNVEEEMNARTRGNGHNGYSNVNDYYVQNSTKKKKHFFVYLLLLLQTKI